MAKFIIEGGSKLKGSVSVSGSKNAALPILAAAILADSPSTFYDIPALNDVYSMCNLLTAMGVSVIFDHSANNITVNPTSINTTIAPFDLVSKFRASFIIAGPVLAKTGSVTISLPGGCAIGLRPVDLHLKGFTLMGAQILKAHGYIDIKAPTGLHGAKIYLDFPSVGATENIMMAAVLARGQTVIENAAIEPEVVDLACCLMKMGADIQGAGSDTIKITGVAGLKGCTYAIIPDRIEAGTFMLAAAVTGGDVRIFNAIPEHVLPVTAKLREMGVEVSEELSALHVKSGVRLKSVDVKTLPYPGFPTDMQAQITPLLIKAKGSSIVVETIFENRFMHVNELARMGAQIKIDGRSAFIEGGKVLTGAEVKATDLRAGAAMVLAGLFADGITEVDEIEHIERGYFDLDQKLQALGAKIQKV